MLWTVFVSQLPAAGTSALNLNLGLAVTTELHGYAGVMLAYQTFLIIKMERGESFLGRGNNGRVVLSFSSLGPA